VLRDPNDAKHREDSCVSSCERSEQCEALWACDASSIASREIHSRAPLLQFLKHADCDSI